MRGHSAERLAGWRWNFPANPKPSWPYASTHSVYAIASILLKRRRGGSWVIVSCDASRPAENAGRRRELATRGEALRFARDQAERSAVTVEQLPRALPAPQPDPRPRGRR